jgi:hypothetical protein
MVSYPNLRVSVLLHSHYCKKQTPNEAIMISGNTTKIVGLWRSTDVRVEGTVGALDSSMPLKPVLLKKKAKSAGPRTIPRSRSKTGFLAGCTSP